MTKRELLENYRLLVIEIESLEKQSRFLNQFIGGPRPVRSVRLTGMPRGTNDPEAAMLQRVETDEVIDKIEDKCEELRTMLGRFEQILDNIHDRRLRFIIRNYYALGQSDERIANDLELTREWVNQLRNDFIRQLE